MPFDAQSIQELIDAHGAALALYARQWCHAPEDAVQEALMDLLRQDRAPEQPLAWLYTTVRRRAMNLARAEGRRVRQEREAGLQRSPWFAPPRTIPSNARECERLLAGLPRLEREIVVGRRIWGELSFAQIAELVQQPLSTVHRRYQRALAQLGQVLEQQEEDAGPIDEPRTTLS